MPPTHLILRQRHPPLAVEFNEIECDEDRRASKAHRNEASSRQQGRLIPDTHALLADHVNEARRAPGNRSLATLDIDHFKRFNDTYDHPVGDHMLKRLARLLQHRLRRSDVIGRMGGKKFAMLLADKDVDATRSVMDDLRAVWAATTHQAGDRTFCVTMSIGIAGLPQPDADLMSVTDWALYAAKHAGRNQVQLAKRWTDDQAGDRSASSGGRAYAIRRLKPNLRGRACRVSTSVDAWPALDALWAWRDFNR